MKVTRPAGSGNYHAAHEGGLLKGPLLDYLGLAAPALLAGFAFFAAAVLQSGRAPWRGRARGLALFMFVIVYEDATPPLEAAPKYARSALDGVRMDRIADKLRRAMAEEKLFADSGLSLRTLAARIKEAERLLVEGEGTILQVAMAVGFNSRSTCRDRAVSLPGRQRSVVLASAP